MKPEEQVAYLDKCISKGNVVMVGKPTRVHVQDGQPTRVIFKVALICASNRHEFPLRAYDDPDIEDTVARLDALVGYLNQVLDTWD